MAVAFGSNGIFHVQSYRLDAVAEPNELLRVRAEIAFIASCDQHMRPDIGTAKEFARWLAFALIATMTEDERKSFIADLVAQRLIQP